jgi:lyso-ornithine lipid O-acyltransferase
MLALGFITLAMSVPVLGLGLVSSKARHGALRWYYRMVNIICGLRLSVHGVASTDAPVLYAANHVSYLDIVLLGAQLNASFVSKAEVRKWPAIGWFARQVGTTFIHRRKGDSHAQVKHLGARLAAGDNLVLFPEGTPSDGTGVLPFKSTLFAALAFAGRSVVVQPVSLLYANDRRGELAQPAYRACYAWFGDGPDDDFGPHAWRMLGLPGMHIHLVFHRPISVDREADRKSIARLCEQAVAAPLTELGATAPAYCGPTSEEQQC